jgi:putative heme-binding domain-containing protein
MGSPGPPNKRVGLQGGRLAVLCVVLVGLGAAASRVVGLLWHQRVTIESGVDPILGSNADNEWEELFAGGDASAGERLFFDTQVASRCGACHTFQGRGEKIGPNLTQAGRFPLPQLIRDIIDPMVTRPRGYESITVVTTDGRVISGFRQGTGDTLVVRCVDGREVTVPPDDVENAFAHSVMPTNYAQQLSLQDFRDLIALLRTAVESESPQDPSAPVDAAPSRGR